jgi:hypothetical protein
MDSKTFAGDSTHENQKYFVHADAPVAASSACRS